MILAWISFAASALYFLTIPWHSLPAQALLKGLAMAPLAALAWTRAQRLLAAALAFSCAGDVILDLDPSLFAAGLGSFLCAHLVYIRMFLKKRTGDPDGSRFLIMGAILAYGFGFALFLTPHLGVLVTPVWAYMGAITGMALAASASGLRPVWVVGGAVLFIASDSLLAYNKFVGPVPLRDWLVWSTYVLGQYGLAFGTLSAAPPRPAR